MDGLLLVLVGGNFGGIRVAGRLAAAEALSGSVVHVAHHGDVGAGGAGADIALGGAHASASKGGDGSEGKHVEVVDGAVREGRGEVCRFGLRWSGD